MLKNITSTQKRSEGTTVEMLWLITIKTKLSIQINQFVITTKMSPKGNNTEIADYSFKSIIIINSIHQVGKIVYKLE